MSSIFIFAGFGPKDLMMLYYFPSFGLLILTSIIILALKRGGHPYPLLLLVFPLAAPIWYLYDKIFAKKTDYPQSMVLTGSIIVILILAIASTALIPETDDAVSLMALVALVSSLITLIIAIKFRNK